MKKIVFLLILIVGCKEPVHKEKKVTSQQPLDISKLVLGISENLKQGDTLTFDFNLTMEHYIRNDFFVFTNQNENILISSKILHGSQEIDDIIDTIKIKKIKYVSNKQDSLNLETFLNNNLKRGNLKERSHYLLKAYSKKDTFYLYSNNLSDRASFIREYFKVASKLFPDENAFKPNEKTLFPILNNRH